MKYFKKIIRQGQLHLLSNTSSEKLIKLGEQRVIERFRNAAKNVPFYHVLLKENNINWKKINSIKTFRKYCPLLNKENTFERFQIHELCYPGALDTLASVLTSSGHSGRYAFGLTTHKQKQESNDMIDQGLELSFEVDKYKTLVINCLPMGVGFDSNVVTIASTSVREDMVMALVQKFAPFYEQIVLVGDPLFLKKLADYSHTMNVNWSEHRIHLVIGEEPFGENYRHYLSQQFGINEDKPEDGFIASSMGTGELGLNLFFETRYTIELRRRIHQNPLLLKELFNLNPTKDPLPMIFAFNPLRTYIEALSNETYNFGKLAVSVLDRNSPLPLFRYQTGDLAALLSHQAIDDAFIKYNLPPLSQPRTALPLVAILGRDKDTLSNGLNINRFKDALFANPKLAHCLTGAFRIEDKSGTMHIHVQLRRNIDPSDNLRNLLIQSLPGQLSKQQLSLYSFNTFPYGMDLDYERKFTYYE